MEVSVKVLPRPHSEIALTGAMGIDQAIPLMNRWVRGPLPLSGAVCDRQAFWVRLSGERSALAEARAAIALDQAPEAGFWEALREQRLPFFRDDRQLWRISLPAATPTLALPGDCLIDWGGAQRWLKTDAAAEEVRRSAAEQRGYPARSPPAVWPVPRYARRALLFEGCVQPLFAPASTPRRPIGSGSACSRPRAAATP